MTLFQHFRLTVSTEAGMMSRDTIMLIDLNGEEQFLTKLQVRTIHIIQHLCFLYLDNYLQVRMIMLTGWVAFLLAWVSTVLFYKTHPSGVESGTSQKLFLYVFGKKKYLRGYKGNDIDGNYEI